MTSSPVDISRDYGKQLGKQLYKWYSSSALGGGSKVDSSKVAAPFTEAELRSTFESLPVGGVGKIAATIPKDNLLKALMKSGFLQRTSEPIYNRYKNYAQTAYDIVKDSDVYTALDTAEKGSLVNALKSVLPKLERIKDRILPEGHLGAYYPLKGQAFYDASAITKEVQKVKEPAKKVYKEVVQHEVAHPGTEQIKGVLTDIIHKPVIVADKVYKPSSELKNAVKDLYLANKLDHTAATVSALDKAGMRIPGNVDTDLSETLTNMFSVYNKRRNVLDKVGPLGKAYRTLFDELLTTAPVK